MVRCSAQVKDFADFRSYAEAIVLEEVSPTPLPYFIGGQSLGGLVAAHVCITSQDQWAGLLLASAAFDVEWTFGLRCGFVSDGLSLTKNTLHKGKQLRLLKNLNRN